MSIKSRQSSKSRRQASISCRVSGHTAAQYDLVLTENALFNTKFNDTFANARDITSSQGVVSSLHATKFLSVPAFYSGYWGSYGAGDAPYQNYFVGYEGGGSYEYRNYFVFDLTGVTQTITSVGLALSNPPFSYTSPDPTETYAINDVADTSISALTRPNTFDSTVFGDLGNGQLGSVVVSQIYNNSTVGVDLNAAGLAYVNSHRGRQIAFGGALTTIALNNYEQSIFGNTDQNGTRDLVLTLKEPGDWYSIAIPTNDSVLRLTTSTIGDGPGDLTNSLNPHIELYGPDGALIAAGVTQADGRNETLTYQPATAGIFRVKITGEAGSAGEYFLSNQLLVPGDFNRDGVRDSSDLRAMLVALTDLAGYAAKQGLSVDDLIIVGDLNHDGAVNNRDIQPMLDLLSGASVGGSASASTNPPTPTTAAAIPTTTGIQPTVTKPKPAGSLVIVSLLEAYQAADSNSGSQISKSKQTLSGRPLAQTLALALCAI